MHVCTLPEDDILGPLRMELLAEMYREATRSGAGRVKGKGCDMSDEAAAAKGGAHDETEQRREDRIERILLAVAAYANDGPAGHVPPRVESGMLRFGRRERGIVEKMILDLIADEVRIATGG